MFLCNEPSAERDDSGNDNSGSPHETLHIDCAPSNQSKSMVLILHRVGQPPCTHRGLPAESERAAGDMAGKD